MCTTRASGLWLGHGISNCKGMACETKEAEPQILEKIRIAQCVLVKNYSAK